MAFTARSIISEINKLLDKKVVVKLVDGRSYVGKLITFDQNTFSVVLGDVESESGKYHRVIIPGTRISEIIVETQPLFDAEEFAALLRERLNLNPNVIRVLPEINAVIVYDRIKVSEHGVEGAGGLAQRIYDVFKEYIESKKRG